MRCLKLYTLGGRRGGVGVLDRGGGKFSLWLEFVLYAAEFQGEVKI